MELQDRLYTSTEVAEILGVSLRSVYRYLEEDKIQAEIKTATGRHRFSKQNIVSFLYPNGETPVKDVSENASASVRNTLKSTSNTSKVTQAMPEQVTQEEEVDWLAKFRAAAEKHRAKMEETPQEVIPVQPEPAVETPKPQPIMQPTAAPVSSLGETVVSDVKTMPQHEEEPASAGVRHYTSSIGGLKELAQYINKTANKSNVSYAFTLNAGLSLHKLIRPFSILHIYVKEADLEFFEKALELSPTEEATAQLGIFLDKGSVLAHKKELHGLSVVSDAQLRKDLVAANEMELASELDETLSL